MVNVYNIVIYTTIKGDGKRLRIGRRGDRKFKRATCFVSAILSGCASAQLCNSLVSIYRTSTTAVD